MNDFATALQEHYSRRSILPAIRDHLQRKGIDPAQVRPEHLYPYDQSHAGGIEASRRLARHAGIEAHSLVVDVGCGFGSAARFLRSEFSCRVVGVDLTPARLQTARELHRLVRMTTGIHLVVGSAQALPLPSQFADVVWTQHVTMNLPDHAAFLRECTRVLKPAGRLASHEWLRDRPGELPFPLPWASTPQLNHAIPAIEFVCQLKTQSLLPEVEDVTRAMQEALERDLEALTASTAPAERLAALTNLVRAASDGLVCCWMITALRADVPGNAN